MNDWLSAMDFINFLEGGLVAGFYFFPIDDIPDGREIVGPAILVFQVVRVLPNVDR